MHFRGDSVREIPFMLFLGLLFAVTVGWWAFLTLTVSVVSETWLLRYSPCARCFPSPSVTGLYAHPILVSSVFQTGQKGLLTCTRF